MGKQFVLQYTKSEGTNTGASYTYSAYGCGQTNNGFNLTCSSGLLFGPTLDTVTGAGSWAAYLAAHPKAFPGGLIAYVNEQRRLGPYKTNHPFSADHDGEDWNFSNTTTYELSSNLKFKNILRLCEVGRHLHPAAARRALCHDPHRECGGGPSRQRAAR